MTYDEMLRMVRAMRSYGGGFVQALSECFLMADDENTQKLIDAFPEYVEKYKEMASHMPDHEGKQP